MRVLQIIDSLDAGGAERMAVNYANALSEIIEFSGLVSTRNEGVLKNQLYNKVDYLFLDKKKTIDFHALLKLKKFVKTNNIEILQVHGTSYFFSVLLKCIYPKVKIIWHDHFGNRTLASSDNFKLKFLSYFFSAIITVNTDLKNWAIQNLHCKVIEYLPNFYLVSDTTSETILNGTDKKRIVCLANLKNPKNHLFLIKAFHESGIGAIGYSLHLVGNDYKDSYSKALKTYIKDNKLSENIFFYGSCHDTDYILSQASFGILTSTFEGFPVAILEYANAKLCVIATNVGEIPTIIQNKLNGFLINSNDSQNLVEVLKFVVHNKNDIQIQLSLNLYESVQMYYSKQVVLSQYLSLLNYICKKQPKHI